MVEKISIYDVEAWGELIIRCDREGIPIITFKDYLKHIKEFNK